MTPAGTAAFMRLPNRRQSTIRPQPAMHRMLRGDSQQQDAGENILGHRHGTGRFMLRPTANMAAEPDCPIVDMTRMQPNASASGGSAATAACCEQPCPDGCAAARNRPPKQRGCLPGQAACRPWLAGQATAIASGAVLPFFVARAGSAGRFGQAPFQGCPLAWRPGSTSCRTASFSCLIRSKPAGRHCARSRPGYEWEKHAWTECL